MMRWRVLNIRHTDIYLHMAVIPCAIYYAVIGHLSLWLSSTLSILLHELAHAIVAAILDCAPSSIELTPLGAVMLLEDELKLSPLKRIIMLLAGPLLSCAICALDLFFTYHGWISTGCGRLILISNISIVMINLLPVLPLDGGRMLHLLLAQIFPISHASTIMRILGRLTGIALIVLNVFVSIHCGGWNLSIAFAGCSILYCTSIATTTAKLQELRTLMDRKIRLEQRRWIKAQPLCVLATLPIRCIVRSLPANKQVISVVINPGTMNIRGVIGENQLLQCYLADPTATVAEALSLSQSTSDNPNNDTN